MKSKEKETAYRTRQRLRQDDEDPISSNEDDSFFLAHVTMGIGDTKFYHIPRVLCGICTFEVFNSREQMMMIGSNKAVCGIMLDS